MKIKLHFSIKKMDNKFETMEEVEREFEKDFGRKMDENERKLISVMHEEFMQDKAYKTFNFPRTEIALKEYEESLKKIEDEELYLEQTFFSSFGRQWNSEEKTRIISMFQKSRHLKTAKNPRIFSEKTRACIFKLSEALFNVLKGNKSYSFSELIHTIKDFEKES